MQLNLFNQLLIQRETLKEGQTEIYNWLSKAEEFMNSLSLAGGKYSVETCYERHKVFFIKYS